MPRLLVLQTLPGSSALVPRVSVARGLQLGASAVSEGSSWANWGRMDQHLRVGRWVSLILPFLHLPRATNGSVHLLFSFLLFLLGRIKIK